tara:strand:+ start:822 stop:1004 length:183 start_codon:yes stop_codon:yes gene_type:complete
MSSSKIEINKKMIGKRVLVINKPNNFTGVVVDCISSDQLQVKRDNSKHIIDVDIYDVRSL